MNNATKRDLSDLRIELVDRMQRIEREMLDVKTQILEIKTQVLGLRNSMHLQIIVPALTLIVSLVIHYILK